MAHLGEFVAQLAQQIYQLPAIPHEVTGCELIIEKVLEFIT